jgi:hypothetical protein
MNILSKGKAIVKQFRSSLQTDTNDIHAKLMSHYKEAPEWWYVFLGYLWRLNYSMFRYTILFVIAFVLAAIVCHFGELMPWYFLFGNFQS